MKLLSYVNLTFKVLRKFVAGNSLELIFVIFSEKLRHVSCELSARKTIHMKSPTLFSLKIIFLKILILSFLQENKA